MLDRSEDIARDLEAELEALVRRVETLVASADEEALVRSPGEGAWSAAECIDHLNATARFYLPALEAAIREGRKAGLTGRRPDGRTLLGRVIVWAMEPPARLKTRTFGELEPGEATDVADLADEFGRLHTDLVAQLREAGDIDGRRVRVRSVLDSRLKLSLDDWYAFLAAHGRRHLWQAERALEPGQ